ncbi:MAG TPA: phosphotransferase [Syntrophales bacterium]|nr:phosphotransferase [Syntrophales bacterium]
MTHLDHEMKQFVRRALGLGKLAAIRMMPVARGGSVRSFHRIRYGDDDSVIFMHYDRGLEENNYYVAIAEFLRGIDVPVPHIMAHDPATGFIVMEDLGDADLWFFRNEPWPVRFAYYRKTLAIAQRLHSFPAEEFPSGKVPLMEAFGTDLYRWERNYFFENFVQAVCGLKLSTSEINSLEAELKELSDRLEDMKPKLVHRDFQSQNVMIREGEPVLVDFQGMRFGNSLYDLGSLLYDPYVSMTHDERMELLRHYYELRPLGGWKEFHEIFLDASTQRLMQALGAYGFLGLKRGLHEFLTHIPGGVANLIDAVTRAKRMPLLQNLALRCRNTLK